MKAKVKSTGQIIDVEAIGKISVRKSIQAFKSKDGGVFKENEIEFDYYIDWEQRRYEIAKEIIVAFASNPDEQICNNVPITSQAQYAIKLTDELIKELKKKEDIQ